VQIRQAGGHGSRGPDPHGRGASRAATGRCRGRRR
jgi:hypothetical protein